MSIAADDASDRGDAHGDPQQALNNMARVLVYDRWQLANNDAEQLLSADHEAERVDLLLSIHKYLRMLFPSNRELAYKWMSQPNEAFDGHRPLEAALTQGTPGLRAILAYLQHATQA